MRYVLTLFAALLFSGNLIADELLNLDDQQAAKGYDVVSYITQQRAEPGKEDYSTTHDGVIYLFASAENKEVFLADPQKYEPAYGGWCAYAMADGDKVDIDPKTFAVIEGKTYLFYNGFWGNTLKKWNKEGAESLQARADEQWLAIVKAAEEK